MNQISEKDFKIFFKVIKFIKIFPFSNTQSIL
jgi:hypothetical protein